jgi:hypothetical protein
MANKKISQLTAAAALTGTELLPIVQDGVTVQTTAQDIADLGGGGTLPVETVYPTTDALAAGQRFWYKGNEWHYMTQDEIDSIGWTGVVSVGFPAPVRKIFDSYIFYQPTDENQLISLFQTNIPALIGNTIFNFLGLGNPVKIKRISNQWQNIPTTIVGFINVNLLVNLEDQGTFVSVFFMGGGLSDTAINNFFTQLPPTTKTATINVSSNPGSATCNPTIATSKGYIVVT